MMSVLIRIGLTLLAGSAVQAIGDGAGTGAATAASTAANGLPSVPLLHLWGTRTAEAPEFKCRLSCNGQEIKPSDDLECWGTYRQACWHSSDDADAGAAAPRPGAADGHDLDSHCTTAHALCSGAFFARGQGEGGVYAKCQGFFKSMYKTVTGDRAAARERYTDLRLGGGGAADFDEPQLPLRNASYAFVSGYGCYGDMTYVRAPDHQPTKEFVECKRHSAKFSAFKAIDAPPSVAAAAAARFAETSARRLERDMIAGGAADAVRDDRAPPDDTSAEAVMAASLPVTEVSGGGGCATRARDPRAGCGAQCNGGPLKLWGWWPCWGHFEFGCSGERDGTCWDIDVKCTGLTLPRFGTCRGLRTAFVESASERGSVKAYTVTTGQHMDRQLRHRGWQVTMEFDRGQSTTRVGRSDGADAADGGSVPVMDVGRAARPRPEIVYLSH